MKVFKPFLIGACALAICAPYAADVVAAPFSEKNWPCAQRKRLDLSIGAIWNGPEVDEKDKSWESDKDLAALVKTVSRRRTTVEEGMKLIDDMESKLEGDKAKRLQQLFVGLFQTLNLERRNIVHGIEKYSSKQFDLSERVKKTAMEVDTLGNKEELTDEDAKKLDELNERLVWDTRIYDERNQSLEYVCESPVLIEQRLFKLAKHIEGKLK